MDRIESKAMSLDETDGTSIPSLTHSNAYQEDIPNKSGSQGMLVLWLRGSHVEL